MHVRDDGGFEKSENSDGNEKRSVYEYILKTK